MKKYSIVASDFDDTLLRSDNTVSDFTRETIAAFVKRGGTFLISTGRMYQSALVQARDLGLKGLLISYQGAMVNDIESGKTLLHEPLSTEDALFNLSLLEPSGGQIHLYANDRLFVKKINDYTRQYEINCGVKAEETKISLSEYVRKNNISPTKLLMIDEANKVKKLVEELEEKYGDKYYYCLSKPVFFEVAKRGVSKGFAVEFVAKSLGKTMEDVLAVGDSLNDVPMIEMAGLGVAVANARDEVKARAKLVGLSNDEDAVAHLILNYCI